jgi:hypothetical protein
LTIVHLTLDSSLKVVNFQAEKTNIKHEFLGDKLGLNFPWLKPKLENPKNLPIDNGESTEEAEQTNEIESDVIENSNLNFLNEMIKNLAVIGQKQTTIDIRNVKKNFNFLFMAFSSSTNVHVDRKIIESFVAFSQQFSVKHKIMFVYVSLKPNESQTKFVNHVMKSNNLEWYTINDLRQKVSKKLAVLSYF